MAITKVDELKIEKYLKEHSIDDIYYLDMCDAIGKRGKIKDIEFLEYFTARVVKEFQKNEKISIKHLTKLIFTVDSFLEWIHKSGSKIKESTLNKIRNFEQFYDDYLNRTNFDIDLDFTDNCIGVVLKNVNKLYPVIREEIDTNSSIKIEELEQLIKKLRKELEELNKLYKKSQVTNDRKTTRVDTLNKKVKTLEKEKSVKEKEILSLSEQIEALTLKIEELEKSLSSVIEENESLKMFREQYDTLSKKIAELNKIIDGQINNKKAEEELVTKQTNIESLIYKKILIERASLEDILKYVNDNGYASNREEIYTLLNRVKHMINIECSSFSLNPKYGVTEASVIEDSKFSIDIPNGCKHYDIMLVSDFHIASFDNKTLSGFDMLNDYCVKNGINLILNLGDFYHGVGTYSIDCDNAIKNYKLIEDSVNLIPKVDGLYHAILGGNHDANILKYGFDPISLLAKEREDFISLGYKHSTIQLNNLNNEIASFDLHHPNIFDFSKDLDDDGIDVEKIIKYLNRIYKRQGRTRDESYIDLFGHTHKSQFNQPSSYYFLPTYFEGTATKRGATHLRIYFDEKKNIKYMVFMPLCLKNKLITTNEIIYEKTLKK